MWFGTGDGLNRYDGYQFKIYRHNPGEPSSIRNNRVTELLEDRLGNLWVGTQTGIDKFDPRTGRFTHFPLTTSCPPPPDDIYRSLSRYIMRICEDRDGMIWIGSLRGLYRLEPGTGQVTCFRSSDSDPGTISNDYITALYMGREGNLWIGARNGLNRWNRENETFTRYFHSSGGENLFAAICDGEKGTLCVVKPGGFFRFNPETGTCALYPGGAAPPSGLMLYYHFSIFKDRGGIIWGGGLNAGLYRFDPAAKTGAVSYYSHSLENPYSLGMNNIMEVYLDRGGIVWIGTEGSGVNKLDPRKNQWTHWNHWNHYQGLQGQSGGLSHNNVHAIREDAKGNLWIGTLGGGLEKYDRERNRFTYYRHQPGNNNNNNGLSSNQVRSLCISADNRIWIGTWGGGVNCLDTGDGAFTHYRHQPGKPYSLSSDFIYHLYPSTSGNIWAGTRKGLDRLDTKRREVTRYKLSEWISNSLQNAPVKTIYEDRSGVLWIGASGGGLVRFNPGGGGYTHYARLMDDENSLGSNLLEVIYESRRGKLWIGTFKGGLNSLDRDTGAFTRYGLKGELPGESVYGILEDGRGNLWLSTISGISMFNPGTGSFRHYTSGDGLPVNDYNPGASWNNGRGEMFFGGSKGITAFHPAKITANLAIPKLAITAFIKGGQRMNRFPSIWETEEIRLSYGDDLFAFEFAALDYSLPGNNRYAYKMEGLSGEWVHTDAEKRVASFSGLEPGTYTFRVKGCNNDGIWNEQGAAIRVVIAPPFWKTWWFASLLLLAGVLTVKLWRRNRQKYLSMRLKSEAEMEPMFEKYGVTKREKEIIGLILKGKTNKDIEDQLYISLNTVKSYIYRIYKKFGVQSRLELIHLIQKSVKND
jgi:ligand-binding sensor domain-containing protein/DNA-binding CsgD family transcriptional regulator